MTPVTTTNTENAGQPAIAEPSSRARAKARRLASVQRLALSKAEAAASIGVSVDFFEEHVMPVLPCVYVGRRRLFAVRELERWLDRGATRP